jgi:condensin complex subunit 3
MLDVSTSDVAEDALLSVFVTRVDIFDSIEFNEDLWSNLNPERAFLVRVFVDHCLATKVPPSEEFP